MRNCTPVRYSTSSWPGRNLVVQLMAVGIAFAVVCGGWLRGESAPAPTGAGGKPSERAKSSVAAEKSGEQAPKPDQAEKPEPGQEKPRAKPRWPVSRETTYFTEPLDKDGYVDYVAAWNAHFSKGVQPEKNAYVRLIQALGPRPGIYNRLPDEFFRKLGIEPLPDKGEYFVSYWAFIREKAKPKEGHDWKEQYENLRQARQRPWKQQDFPLVAEWLEVNQKPLQIIAEAAERPQWFRPIVFRESTGKPRSLQLAELPELQLLRDVVQAYLARSMWHCARGQTKQAWQDILTALRLARTVSQDPVVLSTLIAIAMENLTHQTIVRYLEFTQPDAKTSLSYYRDLQNLRPRRPLAEIVDQGERVLALDTIQLFYRYGWVALDDSEQAGVLSALQHRFMQRTLPWKKMLVIANQYYDILALTSNEPDRARRQEAYESLYKKLKEALEHTEHVTLRDLPTLLFKPGDKAGERIIYLLLALVSPAITRVQNAVDQCDQYHQLLLVALGLEIFRAETGQYPAKLEDLSPKYIPAIPEDIFSGYLPIYRRTERGYLLYSVGPNGQDDGGRTREDNPRGDDLRIQISTTLPDKAKPDAKPEPPENSDL